MAEVTTVTVSSTFSPSLLVAAISLGSAGSTETSCEWIWEWLPEDTDSASWDISKATVPSYLISEMWAGAPPSACWCSTWMTSACWFCSGSDINNIQTCWFKSKIKEYLKNNDSVYFMRGRCLLIGKEQQDNANRAHKTKIMIVCLEDFLISHQSSSLWWCIRTLFKIIRSIVALII